MSSILVVCTGNICRSQVGEAAFRELLPADRFEVSSAGTHAAVGRGAHPETEAFIAREFTAPHEYRPKQLTKAHAESSDLIMTMTEEHRAWVAKNSPRAVRRTFTMRELETIALHLAEDACFPTLKDFSMAASRLRVRTRDSETSMDIEDPIGGPHEGYVAAFSEVLDSARRITNALYLHLSHD